MISWRNYSLKKVIVMISQLHVLSVSFYLTTEAWLYPIDLRFNNFPETIYAF